MPAPLLSKIITANALRSGDVVYFTLQNTWSPRFRDAEVLTDSAHADVRLLEASANPQHVVGVYLADVRIAGDQVTPHHFREAFRAKGPSNYAHGKQESQSHV